MNRAPDLSRPGLAKAGRPLVRERTLRLVQLVDGEVAQAFERADVVSEGAVRAELGGLVYYGSTSVVLPRSAFSSDLEPAVLCSALACDLHARLRALRIACREARLRCGGPARTTEAELLVRAHARGVAFECDVVVRLTAGVARWRR